MTYNTLMLTYLYALIAAVVVLCAHVAGNNGFYGSIPQYDIGMHILGGITIALFVAALLSSFAPQLIRRKRTIVLIVLCIGIVWELFEAYYDIAGYHLWTNAYYLDTAKDLLDDVIGAGLVAWLWKVRS